jgi:hypothetical protein
VAELVCHNDTQAILKKEIMNAQRFDGSVKPKVYFNAVRKGTVVLTEGQFLIVSKVNKETIKVVIEQNTEHDTENPDPWLGFFELPPDLFAAFFQIVPANTSLVEAITEKFLWFVEGIMHMEENKNLNFGNNEPVSTVTKFFGEDWRQYSTK